MAILILKSWRVEFLSAKKNHYFNMFRRLSYLDHNSDQPPAEFVNFSVVDPGRFHP